MFIIPEPTLAWGVSPGTNSTQLFTLGERNALAKSKVHQILWAHGYEIQGWTSSQISKIWLFARSGISTLSILKQDFNFQKHIFGKSHFTQ